MKKQTNSVFARLRNRARALKHRVLRMEMLEGRRVMTASEFVHHNHLIAEDVNKDFQISPIDALLVINSLNNRSAAGEGEGDQGKTKYLDVSGDGVLTPLDALLVINELNAEGEGPMLISYTVQITNAAGAPITSIPVGSEFFVKVFAQDLRTTGATGVGSAGFDLDLVGSELETNLVDYPPLDNTLRVSDAQFFSGGALGASGSNEEFDEISMIMGFSKPPSPGEPKPVINAKFLALKAGEISFGLNAPETAGAESVLYDDSAAIPVTSIMYAGLSKLTIIADPSAPVAVNDTVTTPEDTSIILAGAGSTLSPALTANDTFTAGRTISVTSLGTIAGVTQGSVSGLTYTPRPNFSGQDRITYTITDAPNGLTSIGTVTINVTEVNDPPVAVADNPPSVPADTTSDITVLANDSTGGEQQTLTIISVGPASNGGTVTVNGNLVRYTPAVGFEGTETFPYTISDGLATASATVTVTVEPATTPFARRDTATIAEVSAGGSGSVKINVLANDKINAGANIKATLISFTQPANGTVTLDDNGTAADTTDDQVVYVPNFEFNGTDTFTYVMNDTAATGANSTGTVVVTVTDVNDAPSAGNDSATGTEDLPVTIAISSLLSNDSPGLGETTTQTLTVTPGTSSAGTVAVVGTNVVFTPNAAVNGNQTFTYIVTDSGSPALTATGTVTVNLAAVNDAPIAGADSRSTDEDTQLVITTASLLTNDAPGRPAATDEGSQTLSITAVSKPAATTGTVTLAGGNITYAPALNFNGTETFTYTVLDSAGASSTGTVTVTVNPINDAPIAGTDSVVAFKGSPLLISVSELLGNDAAGPANETGQTPLSITAVSGAVNGTVSLNASLGIITFTPAAGYSGPASFQYTVADSGPTGGSNVNSGTGTVEVNVRDFVPTTVSGKVWVDDTHDGIIDGAERKLGGVEVVLTGSTGGVSITPKTYITLADGSYHFDNLAPGQYVVRFATPAYFSSANGADAPGGTDVPGALGDADSVDNQFTINIAQPGGGDGSGYNFAIAGLETRFLGLFSSLLASNFMGNASNIRRGVEAVLGDDNSSIWMSKLEGFDAMVAGEVVLNSAGNRLQLTMVDANEQVYTATLMPSQFRVVTDNATGNRLVRVFGDASSISFQQISLASPPVVSYNRYLEAIDEIFAQEGWDGVA